VPAVTFFFSSPPPGPLPVFSRIFPWNPDFRKQLYYYYFCFAFPFSTFQRVLLSLPCPEEEGTAQPPQRYFRAEPFLRENTFFPGNAKLIAGQLNETKLNSILVMADGPPWSLSFGCPFVGLRETLNTERTLPLKLLIASSALPT
jgi:hypothetical protein